MMNSLYQQYLALNRLRDQTERQTKALLKQTSEEQYSEDISEQRSTYSGQTSEKIDVFSDDNDSAPEVLEMSGNARHDQRLREAFNYFRSKCWKKRTLFRAISEGSPDDRASSQSLLNAKTLLCHAFVDNLVLFKKMLLVYLLVTVLTAIFPIAMGYIITHHADYVDLPHIMHFVFFLSCITLGVGLLNILRVVCFAKYERAIIYHVQSGIMKKLFSLPVSFFEQYAVGDLCHRVMMIESLARMSGQNQMGVLLSFVFSSTGFLTMLYFSWKLTLVTLSLVCIYFAFLMRNIKKQLPYIERYMSDSAHTAAFMFHVLNGITCIKVFLSDVFAKARWADLYSRGRHSLFHLYRYGIWRFTFINNMLLLTLIIVFYLGTQWVSSQMSATDYVIFYTAFIQFMSALVSFSMQSSELAFSICAFRRLRPILESAPEPQADVCKEKKITLKGRVVINAVHFHYPNTKLPILNQASCIIEPGEHVAIVGLSGAGKSTLLKLLLGFYFPQQGDILFDDQSIHTLNLTQLRDQIGVVLQNSKLMTGSLLSNLLDAYPHKTEEDAWQVAELVGLSAFIASLPMKMHTMVSQHINLLSGGQQQLLLIARALIGKPRLLLLDEATHSLDSVSQHHVITAIRRLPMTCISIAHQASAMQYADRILMLEQGRIVENVIPHTPQTASLTVKKYDCPIPAHT